MQCNPKNEVDNISKRHSPLVVSRQNPVGHGGFHTGALGFKRPEIRWVYDCGAWSMAGKKALKDKILEYKNKIGTCGEVDLLFVSHFDADHTNGLREFLRSVRVKTVIVPYLEREEIFGVLAEAAWLGTRKLEISELGQVMLNPGLWFGKRRVLRVIRLRSNPTDGAAKATLILPPIEPSSRTESSFQVEFTGTFPKPRPTEGRVAEIIDADSEFDGAVSKTDWSFLPFVHPVSDAVSEFLREAAYTLVGVKVDNPNFDQKLVELIGCKDGIKKLREIYKDREIADANGKSLSLYIGPLYGVNRTNFTPNNPSQYGSGWLLTGDAKLGSRYRRTAWLNHYQKILCGQVGYLMLPHHGAAANFHPDIVSTWKSATLFITCNAEAELRPHEDVKSKLKNADDNRKIWRVTEKPCTEIWQVSGAPEYEFCSIILEQKYADWA